MSFLVTVVMLVLVFDCGNCNMQRFEAAKSIRVEDSAFILHRDSRSNHRYRRSVLNSTEMQEALEAHNRLRRLEGASDMEIMVRLLIQLFLRTCSMLICKICMCVAYGNSELQCKYKEGLKDNARDVGLGLLIVNSTMERKWLQLM